ncbi:MAG: nodulation protein NfeD [Bdellovibrionota bacterium]|nr:MAG: nodulation protein NfeD [Bdellovibrionota bacterium]
MHACRCPARCTGHPRSIPLRCHHRHADDDPPRASAFLEESITRAHEEGAKILIVRIDTPGGILQTSQEMVQTLFRAPLPVVIYVSPTGATATSAGVFITLAGHVAAMAPGTSIGAAHPVAGDGKDIEGDMRTKAENMTVAMVKAIGEQRGRNVEWAEKAVKESVSVTEREAVKLKVVDLVAQDIDELLKSLKGLEVKVGQEKRILEDYSSLPRTVYQMSLRHEAINVLANPNVAALLWLAATTGISIELYNPGLILPGVVGVICLILALAVSQIIPLSMGGVLLFVLGSVLIGLELVLPSGILGVGGIIAIALGAFYLFDESMAPGVHFEETGFVISAVLVGVVMLGVAIAVRRAQKRKVTTGTPALIGMRGTALETVGASGQVFVNGEIWRASAESGLIAKDSTVEVVGIEGLTLRVKAM